MTNAFGFAGPPLKPRVSFDELVRRVTDAWLESSSREASADSICKKVEGLLKINMLLAIVETAPDCPSDWRVRFVQLYGIPSSLVATDALQVNCSLRDIPDQTPVSKIARCQSIRSPDLCDDESGLVRRQSGLMWWWT